MCPRQTQGRPRQSQQSGRFPASSLLCMFMIDQSLTVSLTMIVTSKRCLSFRQDQASTQLEASRWSTPEGQVNVVVRHSVAVMHDGWLID
eukprot:m.333155 g.333155  ORF g.333155 m.333155 type:complete len:90 (+) comp27736_c0_seq11:545-814(+)